MYNSGAGYSPFDDAGELNTMFDLRTNAINGLIGGGARLSLLSVLAFLFFGGQAQAAPPDTMPIWRAQVQFVTSGVDDAGSDDDVKIELNGANRTWLESGFNDFEPGTRTYDLRMEGVSRLSDIDFFRIQKTGSDGWAIRNMSLIINGVPIFHEEFQPALWLDNSGGSSNVFFIDDFFMRQRADWANYLVPVRPNIVPLEDMRSRIESLAGDKAILHSNILMHRIGDHSVELFTLNANTWRVDLDFEEDKQFPAPNINIDADFDLTITCSGGRPNFVVSNSNTDDDWPLGTGADGVRFFVNSEVGPRLNEMMKNFNYLPCPNIVLAPNGDLHFNPLYSIPTENVLVLDDNPSPLGLHVIMGANSRFSSNTLVATLRSRLGENADLGLSFTLPVGIALSNSTIQVRNRNGIRTISATVARQPDGSSVVSFHDRVPATGDTEYALPLRVRSREDGTEQIAISATPATRGLEELITPLRAASFIRFSGGLADSEGTITGSSKYRQR